MPVVINGTTGINTPGVVNTAAETIATTLAVTGATSLATLTTSSTVTHNAGTANGVAFLNASKVLTTGSALTFDGSAFKVNVGTNLNVITQASGSAVRLNYSNDAGSANVDAAYRATNFIYQDGTGAETMRLTSTGLGIGTSSPLNKLDVRAASAVIANYQTIQAFSTDTATVDFGGGIALGGNYSGTSSIAAFGSIVGRKSNSTGGNFDGYLAFGTNNTSTGVVERARIDSSGNLLVGKTVVNVTDGGFLFTAGAGTDQSFISTNIRSDGGGEPVVVNRQGSNGTLIDLRQANTSEGTISVSGTTVSYNGGHLSRWAQTTAPKDDTLVKGTVLSNLDAMNVYTKDGQPDANEQLNKVKVSDTEGDVNVAGVFVNWTHDEDHNVDEINMAMTGDMIIRIAQGVTVVRGDLLMSAGDGTAKPQGDDIVRSKTVAKVTSTHVTCTYADGSFCVPCVLMAC